MIAEWLAEKRATSHWLSIIASTADEFMEDRISLIAAGATFFVMAVAESYDRVEDDLDAVASTEPNDALFEFLRNSH